MIKKAYRYTLLFRWSLVSTAAIALFWFGWYLVDGSVPIVTDIKLTPTWSVTLPFAMSRWWDILIGPIWSVMIMYWVRQPDFDGDSAHLLLIATGIFLVTTGIALDISYLAGPVAIALGISLLDGYDTGLAASLGIALIAGLGVGLIAVLGVVLCALGKWLILKGMASIAKTNQKEANEDVKLRHH